MPIGRPASCTAKSMPDRNETLRREQIKQRQDMDRMEMEMEGELDDLEDDHLADASSCRPRDEVDLSTIDEVEPPPRLNTPSSPTTKFDEVVAAEALNTTTTAMVPATREGKMPHNLKEVQEELDRKGAELRAQARAAERRMKELQEMLETHVETAGALVGDGYDVVVNKTFGKSKFWQYQLAFRKSYNDANAQYMIAVSS